MTPAELAALATPEARVVALGGGVALLAVLGPRRLARLPSPCLVRLVFGRCPTCGVTRSVAALARGDLSPRPRRGLGALVLVTIVGILAADVRRLLSGH
ncbi:MAG TPA: DUF2752 domain-containing protein [Acidimicrobiales bacterium]|nr:DUF2752 domain-containing protein [Acidimicrobiales bacterium]